MPVAFCWATGSTNVDGMESKQVAVLILATILGTFQILARPAAGTNVTGELTSLVAVACFLLLQQLQHMC